MRRIAWFVFSLVGCGGSTLAAPPALQSGDLLIANHEVYVFGHAGVVKVDPVTGRQTVLAMGGLIGQPNEVVTNAARDTLYIADSSAAGSGAVVAVNIANGRQSIVASGGLMGCPERVAIESSGQLLLSYDCFFTNPGLVRVNPATGAQSDVCDTINVWGVDVDITGQIFVTSSDPVSPIGRIVRVDPVTGAETTISSGGFLTGSRDLAIGPTGDILVLDHVQGAEYEVVRVDPTTGVQSLVSSGGLLDGATGLAVAANGDIYVVNMGQESGGPHPADGIVFRVDPVTGAQTIVSQGKKLLDPLGIWIVP